MNNDIQYSFRLRHRSLPKNPVEQNMRDHRNSNYNLYYGIRQVCQGYFFGCLKIM